MGKIREAMDRDLIIIKKMTDAYIGADFYTMSFLKEIYNSEDKFLYVYANDRDETVAYFYIFISSLQEALKVLNVPYELLGADGIQSDGRVGVYKTSCTEKDYRNKGIFTSFLYNLEEVFKKYKVERVFLPALKTPSGVIPVQNVVLSAGFHKVGEIRHPWSAIASYCPYCRNGNCQCDCVLYTKGVAYE